MYHPYIYLQENFRTITVTGNSEISVKPNLAEIQIEVVTEGVNVNTAQQQNAEITNRVIQAILALSINRDDIQTAFYQVSPKYDYIEGRQVFRGYVVSNAITVTVRNINQVGRVIDTAVEHGANRISSLQFKLDNEEAYYNKALSLAIENANSKATAITRSFGIQYNPNPIEVVEQSVGGPIILRTASFSQEAAVATPIEPGLIKIEAAVQVKYQY